jgi:hypothetical protein
VGSRNPSSTQLANCPVRQPGDDVQLAELVGELLNLAGGVTRRAGQAPSSSGGGLASGGRVPWTQEMYDMSVDVVGVRGEARLHCLGRRQGAEPVVLSLGDGVQFTQVQQTHDSIVPEW